MKKYQLNNVSEFSDSETASTQFSCALARAENLACLGVKTVLELCVGPSLKKLEEAYRRYGIDVVGNDIDPRWRDYYSKGKWLVGDAIRIAREQERKFDAIVVAPPLSRGCSGTREDSLSLEEVTPGYDNFLNLKSKITVYVLPGRTLSLKNDRIQLFKFLKKIEGKIELIPLKDSKGKVTKYLDIYENKR